MTNEIIFIAGFFWGLGFIYTAGKAHEAILYLINRESKKKKIYKNFAYIATQSTLFFIWPFILGQVNS